jgi:hypothetical protein
MSTQPQRTGPLPYPRIQTPVTQPRWTMPFALPETLKQLAKGSRETLVVLFAVFTYFFVRGLMSTSVDRAYEHAHDLLSLERWLGIAREADLQRWAHDVPGLMDAMNSVYIWGHWPVIGATLAWLLWKHPHQFRTMRTAMVVSGLIGFAFFALYPMAPPRFLPELGFVDTVMRDTSSYRVLQPPAFTNQYAAMPSLHVGWNLLMGIAIWTTTRHVAWKTFAIVMPLLMWVATILTANHFLLDGVVGSAVALTGLVIAVKVTKEKGAPAHEPVDSRAGGGG